MINLEADIPMPPPYGGLPPTITRTPNEKGGQKFVVQLVDVIGPLTQYLEVLTVLDYATEQDEVEIMIDTPGGDVYTTQLLVERMTNCRAPVTTIASGLVASAGTMLWFYGKNKRVDRWARFLFHCSSHGDWGKSLQIQENSTNLVNYIMNLLAQMLAEGFISGAEYDKMKAKGDVTVAGSVLRERWEAIRAEAGGDNGGGEGGEGGDNAGGGEDNPPNGKKKGKAKADGDNGGDGGENGGSGEGGENGDQGGEGGKEPEKKGDDDGADFDPDAIYKDVLGDKYKPAKGEEGEGGAEPEKKEGEGEGAGKGGEGGEGGSGEGGEGAGAKKCSKCGKNPCTCK